jgi:hypothetical protein
MKVGWVTPGVGISVDVYRYSFFLKWVSTTLSLPYNIRQLKKIGIVGGGVWRRRMVANSEISDDW